MTASLREASVPPLNVRCSKDEMQATSSSVFGRTRNEMRARIKNTLQDYPGIADHESLMRQKAKAGADKLRVTETEYWANLKKMKEQASAKWKFPEDSYKDRRPVRDEIMEKADKANKVMSETASSYKAWVSDMGKKTRGSTRCKCERKAAATQDFCRQEARGGLGAL